MTKKPREYAQEVIKRMPVNVNEMLDEMECPEEFREMVKHYVYFGLAKAWSIRKR